MTPYTLYIRNFKSYGENTPVLDFNKFDIALLTGENGNGKSSLADAIAWCIWGQCKGMSGRGGMDDLVHTGALDMDVAFTFEEDGNIYKVIRKRDKKRGQSALEFYIKQGAEFISISGNGIGETQQKILEIIKLDYDTYLCTAYLSQGKADLFATKKPNERKEVLGEILNLSTYDKLEGLAAEKRREVVSELTLLERQIEGFKENVLDEKEISKGLLDVEENLKAWYLKRDILRDKLSVLNRKKTELDGLKQQAKDYKAQLVRSKHDLVKLKKESETLAKRIQEYRDILKKQDAIKRDYDVLNMLVEQDKKMGEALQRITELKSKKQSIESQIKALEQELNHRIALIDQKILQEKNKVDASQGIDARLKDIRKTLLKLKEDEDKLSILQQKKLEIAQSMVQIKTDKKALLSQMDELREHYYVLKDVEADCPVCKRPLDGHTKTQIMDEAIKKGREIQKHIKDMDGEIIKLKTQDHDIDVEIARLKEGLKERSRLEGQLVLMEKSINEGDEAKKAIETLKAQLMPIKSSLKTGSYREKFNDVYEDICKQLDSIEYDRDGHVSIKNRIKELKDIPELFEEIKVAKVKLSADGESRTRILGLIEDRENDIRAREDIIDTLEKAAAELPEISKDIKNFDGEVQKLEELILQGESKKGALNERLLQIQRAKEELKEKKRIQDKLLYDLEVYKALVNIYGKKGIQAAIIENAIPELQDETNRILSKITDGRFTVEFITQRDTSTGNILETLDIKISDGMETRKYETYSGGEEFRINFAIRIALAKMLARRAGANLRMLILDEGFGVLDEAGRERLAQVINSISDEFEKIMVITHIQDLKDYFPTQIEVYMTSEGSMFKIVG
ncbi:AAA family ATPase [Xylanivirga thermophila]|jgi:exonuclease SbcC|uniref:AAA family ATPase n=1 Tax=Xylanivirga thermophila TaxID=2496273 RepID=UPI00101C0D4A|nr:SMC family ATPase [Xylanivirga thermophila]